MAIARTSVRTRGRRTNGNDEVGEHPVADDDAEHVAARQSGAPVEQHDIGERKL